MMADNLHKTRCIQRKVMEQDWYSLSINLCRFWSDGRSGTVGSGYYFQCICYTRL